MNVPTPPIDPAIKHVNFVVPARAGTQRLTGVRHWIPAFAGMTNLKNLNIFSCRLNKVLKMPNTSIHAVQGRKMPENPRGC